MTKKTQKRSKTAPVRSTASKRRSPGKTIVQEPIKRYRESDPEVAAANRSKEELRNKIERTIFAIVHYHYLTDKRITAITQDDANKLVEAAARAVIHALNDLY